jgi:hypothetical protein
MDIFDRERFDRVLREAAQYRALRDIFQSGELERAADKLLAMSARERKEAAE